MAKEGSTISGFADCFAQAISYALQYGVPLQVLVDKFSHARFEPAGMTKNPEVRFAKSIVDYVFRWMASKFLSEDAKYRAGVNGVSEPEVVMPSLFDQTSAPAATATVTNGSGTPVRANGTNGAAGTAFAPHVQQATASVGAAFAAMRNQEDAPPCTTCGSIMVRSGACYKCSNCGTTSGCA
jgi:ribonucleoside-diphosphate reductase alpha chain